MNPPDRIAVSLVNVFSLALPEIVLGVVACILFVGATFRVKRDVWAIISLVGLAAAGIALARSGLPATSDAERFIQPLVLDRLAQLVKLIALVGGAVLVLFSWDEIADRHAAEYYGCLLVIVAGVCLTGAANELVTLFLALELISIPTYVLLYLQRSDRPAQEAAIKYFLLSIFSTAMLLFGFSYMYGMTGTTNLPAMLNALAQAPESGQMPLLSLVALVMIAAGLGFKITAVPFHFYAPDVYQGTTFSAAALLAFVPKVAGFVAFLRVLGYVWWQPVGLVVPGLALGPQTAILFWILATMTMCVGNMLALLQDNLKRILAYSSVAHAGYMLIGLAVAPSLAGSRATGGTEAILFYLVAYGAMTIGAFAVLSYLSTPEQPVETVDDLAGLSKSHPGVSLLMALFLFSLIGMPATAGFVGKMLLFMGALEVPVPAGREEAAGSLLHYFTGLQVAPRIGLFQLLALIGAINAAAGAWYYLRIVAAMYLRNPLRTVEKPRAWPGLIALWICAAFTLVLGVYPKPLVEAARLAVSTSSAPATSQLPAQDEAAERAER